MKRPSTVAFNHERAVDWLAERHELWSTPFGPHWPTVNEMVREASDAGLIGGEHLAVEFWHDEPPAEQGWNMLVVVVNPHGQSPLRLSGTPHSAIPRAEYQGGAAGLANLLAAVAREVEDVLSRTIAALAVLDASDVLPTGGPVAVSLMIDVWSDQEQAYHLGSTVDLVLTSSEGVDWQGWAEDKATKLVTDRFPGRSKFKWSLATAGPGRTATLAEGTLG